MLQKPWIKIFIWFLATFFFFLTAAVIISILKPGPTENEVMQFEMGMMAAMDYSMMGASMNLEHNQALQEVIGLSRMLFFPLIFISIFIGLAIRLLQWRNNHYEQ